jgi:hypothetical protein
MLELSPLDVQDEDGGDERGLDGGTVLLELCETVVDELTAHHFVLQERSYYFCLVLDVLHWQLQVDDLALKLT